MKFRISDTNPNNYERFEEVKKDNSFSANFKGRVDYSNYHYKSVNLSTKVISTQTTDYRPTFRRSLGS